MSKVKKIIIGLIIFIFLTIGVGFGLFYFNKVNKIVTVLTMDINPSIAISLNYKNEVVKVEGLNEDGKDILKDNKLKGNTLEKAIENITESVIEKGYVTAEENHILINIEGKNIENEVVTLINNEFKEKNTECNVITQEINEEAKKNAEKYGISESKASYIESIIKENKDITFEELKDKSINEINKTVKEKEEEKQQAEEQKKEEEKKKEEEQKQEENKQNQTSNNNNNNNNSNSSSQSKPNKKPVYTPPASNDRTGAWCDFYKTIPPEGGVEYETPGYINDTNKYVEASKKYFPADSSWSTYYSSITRYRTASYCSAGIVEVENYDKTKKYKVYLDSVTLELLQPVVVTELEKPKIDEAGAKVIVTKWLLDTYGVDINTCGHQYFYYAIDGSTSIPEWQFSCKVDETKTYYAVVVIARDGSLKNGRTWGE